MPTAGGLWTLSGGAWKRRGRADVPAGSVGHGPVGSYQPDATSSGVPAGTALTTHTGTITATAGQTIENLDVHGRVVVKVAGVTIRNCRIRGAAGETAPLIQCYDTGASGLLVEDCTLRPDVAPTTAGPDGITGHDYTIRRCDISGTIDGCGIYNTSNPSGPMNVLIEQCYVHDLCFLTPDSGHSDNHSHNDCVQIQGGGSITIRGNNFAGFTDPTTSVYGAMYPNPGKWSNSVLQCTQNVGTISGVDFSSNWVDGGAASLNLSGNYTSFGRLVGNHFGRNQRLQGSGGDTTYTVLMSAATAAGVTVSGNTYADTGTPILVRTNGS